MEIKERIINFLQTAEYRKFVIIIFLISMLLMFALLIKKSFEISRENSADAIISNVDGSYKFNLQGDINRLECTFEQRHCYYNNLGLDRNSIINNCHDIDYCEKLGDK